MAIIGLGAMGSAVAYHLARRGRRVIGFDRFAPPHAQGSSHGQTRIIRQAYFEHPLYVPLVQRAYQLWRELEREADQPLMRLNGGLAVGFPDGALIRGVQSSAGLYRLTVELLLAVEIRHRFPAFRPPDEMIGVLEPKAGMLFPEACIGAHLMLARRHGAGLHCQESVVGWRHDGDGIRVKTNEGEYGADRLVVTAGAWVRSLVSDLSLPVTIERQVMYWFDPAVNSQHFGPERCPISLWEDGPGRLFYGFPNLGEGIKIGRHHEGQMADPDQVRREVEAEEIDATRQLLNCFLPAANGRLRAASVCLYTNTPDFHFLLDAHPQHPNVFIVSPCSGHGFKFSSVIGEIVADLVTIGATGFDVGPFRISRFSQAAR